MNVHGACVGISHLDASHVRRNDRERRKVASAQMLEEHRQRVKMVHRDVEEALNLLRVQIDREHAVHPGGGDEVGHQLGGDGHAGTVLAVLASVAEKRA